MRLATAPAEFGDCRTVVSGDTDPPRDIIASFKIDEFGMLESVELADDPRGWQKTLASCALSHVVFDPELREGEPKPSSGAVTLTVVPTQGGVDNEFVVESVGELTTPPRLRARVGDTLGNCIPRDAPRNQASRVKIMLTISAEGQIAAAELPAGTESWVTRTFECLRSRIKLYPGSRNGLPVETKVAMPMLLNEYGDQEISPASPPTDRELVESAYRACYPSSEMTSGTVVFKFDVNVDGSVSNAKVVKPSGDPVLDKAAACILPRLRFAPTKRGGKPIRSNITWELPVRPPR